MGKTREFWERLFGSGKAGVAGDVSSALMTVAGVDGVESPVDLDDFARATTNMSWLYRAIHLKASNAAMVRPRIYKEGTDQEITSGAMFNLLKRVNTGDTWYSFAYRSFFDLTWAGEITWELARAGRRVAGITTINPRLMKPVPGATGIDALEIQVGGRSVEIGKGDFVYYHRYNPTEPHRGLSVIQTVANTIASDWNLQLRMNDLLKNGAIPSGILSFPEVLGRNQVKQVRSEWQKVHGASRKAGRTAVLSGGAKYDRMSLSPQELQVLEMRKFTRDEISTVTGVPPFMLGSSDSVNYNNAQEQRAAFWHETMLPELEGEFYGSINEYLVPLVQPGVEVRPDLTRIQQLITTEAARVENATKGFQRGILTRNEARKAIGSDPLAEGDVLLDPLNSRMVDSQGGIVYDPTAGFGSLPEKGAEPESTKSISFKSEEPEPEEEPTRHGVEEKHKAAVYNRFFAKRNEAALKLNRFLRAELTKRRERIIQSILDSTGAMPEIDLSVERDGAALFRALAPQVAGIIVESAEETARRITGKSSGDWNTKEAPLPSLLADFDLEDPKVLSFLTEFLLENTKGLTENQLEKLKSVLAEAQTEGFDIHETAKALEAADIAFTEVSSRRAALTWSGAAINLGVLESGERFDIPYKSWLSQRIGESRQWHIDLEGKGRIGRNESWTTQVPTKGGTMQGNLRFPNDPTGLPDDIYNCHCTILLETDPPEDGKSINLDNYYRSFNG